MSSQPEQPVQTAGFWIFGFLSVVLAVLKLTVAVYCVVESDAAIAGVSRPQRAVYSGLLCFRWLKHEEEESTTAEKHSRKGYNIAALLFFFLFLDNLLRNVERQGWEGFWPCSGRFEVVVLYGVLSLLAQFAYWSLIVSGLNQEHA